MQLQENFRDEPVDDRNLEPIAVGHLYLQNICVLDVETARATFRSAACMEAVVGYLTLTIDLLGEVGERFLRRIENPQARVGSELCIDTSCCGRDCFERMPGGEERQQSTREAAANSVRGGITYCTGTRSLESCMVECCLRLIDQAELDRRENDDQKNGQGDDRFDDRRASMAG